MAIPEREARIAKPDSTLHRQRETRMFGRRKPESRATLIETPHLPRVALGPWGSLVYPWWFGTTRLRFKSGRTHPYGEPLWDLTGTTLTGGSSKSLNASSDLMRP